MQKIKKYSWLYRQALKTSFPVSLISAAIILIATLLVAVLYPLWPAMTADYERGTHDIPWSVRAESEDDSRSAFMQFDAAIKNNFPKATVVYATNSDGAVSTVSKSINEMSESDFVKIEDVQYLKKNNAGLYPIDVFSSPNFVIDGDPYTHDGLIVDAISALRLGMHAGDIITIGSFLPEGNVEGSLKLSMSNSHASNYFLEKKVVSAIVMPSANFWGFACFSIEGYDDAWERLSDSFATDAYVFDLSEKQTKRFVKNHDKHPFVKDFYLDPGYTFIQNSEDQYQLNQSAGNASMPLVIALGIIMLITVVLSIIRTCKKRSRFYASIIATGITPTIVRTTSIIEGVASYALLTIIGGVVGLNISTEFKWITPDIALETWLVLALLLTICAVIQIGLSLNHLSNNNLNSLIKEE